MAKDIYLDILRMDLVSIKNRVCKLELAVEKLISIIEKESENKQENKNEK